MLSGKIHFDAQLNISYLYSGLFWAYSRICTRVPILWEQERQRQLRKSYKLF